MANYEYTKEQVYAEWQDAKDKDIKLGKGDDNVVHTNRIALLKDYINLEKNQPGTFDYVNINFNNLLKVYQSANPRDTFYQSVFGMSYEEKKNKDAVKHVRDYSLSDKKTIVEELA